MSHSPLLCPLHIDKNSGRGFVNDAFSPALVSAPHLRVPDRNGPQATCWSVRSTRLLGTVPAGGLGRCMYAPCTTPVLQCGPLSISERNAPLAPVSAARATVEADHPDQVQVTRVAVRNLDVDGIAVHTAERLRGKFDIEIVLHHLSSCRDVMASHLRVGWFCALSTRRVRACLMVAHAGVPELWRPPPRLSPSTSMSLSSSNNWAVGQAAVAHLEQPGVCAP